MNLVHRHRMLYDFIVKITFKSKDVFIIMELDGQQHFEFCKNNIFNRKASYIVRHNRDLYKMRLAIEHNYHFIRLYQPDIWNDTFDWKKDIIDIIEYILLNPEIPITKCISKNNKYENFEHPIV